MTYTNFDLLKIADYYGIKIKVMMNDELANSKYENGYYIVNLEDIKDDGSHWCALIIKNNSKIYWDSYGCLPSEEIEDFLRSKSDGYYYNNKIVQSLESLNCGIYSLGLLIYVNKYKNKNIYDMVDEYTNLFSNVSKENDKIIEEMFITQFKNV